MIYLLPFLPKRFCCQYTNILIVALIHCCLFTYTPFIGLVMDKTILEGQGRGSIRDLPRPFLLKKSLFYKQWN